MPRRRKPGCLSDWQQVSTLRYVGQEVSVLSDLDRIIVPSLVHGDVARYSVVIASSRGSVERVSLFKVTTSLTLELHVAFRLLNWLVRCRRVYIIDMPNQLLHLLD